ncbi:MAG: hypothetical protein ACYTFG_13290, partial [Planctomycetota bacterium]
MKDLGEFKNSIESIIDQARKKVEREKTLLARLAREREKDLLAFDSIADRLQAEIISPRVKHLASLFDNAFEPQFKEEVDYRHRSHLHFGHTD